MYGYIRAYKPELRFREYDVYQACYCGLCEALHRQYGTAARWTLSYDMTFLILLLTGLYEPKEQKEQCRCMAHPFRKQMHFRSEVTSYAADMSILLFHDKCMDDWMDERKFSRRAAAGVLHHGYRLAQNKYPEKAKQITAQLDALHAMEKAGETNPELPAGCFGTLLGELFVWKDDIWEKTLRDVGFYLGKFIYLLDAYDDLEHDRKKGCYNPLLSLSASDPAFHQTCERLLQMMMASCASAFERLPILKYDEILRNILYAGVWTQFYQRKKEYERQENDHGSI
ncbi:DUF5685 family protein [uncultured Ruminococcus sp.]|uniref:DUF5685 family protein n=1 Tax=uncultured Ruminococcus sp. TaxID=165186 RepID=UPI002635B198|nr:DUF5685 family protein [uncultured Ruminococcus sp.]